MEIGNHDDMFELLRETLLLVLTARGLEGTIESIGPDTSVTEDLGLDSMLLLDFSIELEKSLGITEFPLQVWIDEQLETGGRFTVASLVRLLARDRT